MRGRLALALGLLLVGCQAEPPEVGGDDPAAAAVSEIDPALLRELLGESLRIDGDQIQADGMLIRLAFDPLIRQTGPVSVQLVQGQGYRLSGIVDGSPLWLLGLRDGDVLTGVDKQAIIGREHELRSSYESRPIRVELTYMRGTEAHSVKLKIASGSAWRSSDSGSELASPPLPPLAPPSSSSEIATELAASLRCTPAEAGNNGRCEIERAVLDKLLGQPDALARQSRVVPSTRDGEPVGFKLFAIRRGSLPSLLGFENGDLIVSVNGRSVATIEAAMAAYEALRNETDLRVAIERRAQPMELEFAIVDKLSGPPAALPREPERKVSPDLRDPFGGR